MGPPRSGTTWLAQVMSEGAGLTPIIEPDNEKTSLAGIWAKRNMLRFPVLASGVPHRSYEWLWRSAASTRVFPELWHRSNLTRALLGSRPWLERLVDRKEQRLVGSPTGAPAAHGVPKARACDCPRPGRLIKSVHGVFASEWIAHVVSPVRTIVVLRSPYAVVASWRRLAMPDAIRAGCFTGPVQEQFLGKTVPLPQSPLGRMTLQLGTMYAALQQAASRNPEWIVTSHEELCTDPVQRFKSLFSQAGLAWGDEAQRAVESRNREGTGFKTNRVASQEVDKWRRDFSDAEKDEVDEILHRTGNAEWAA